MQLKHLPIPVRWMHAARIKTLGLSITPVVAGTLLAAQAGEWKLSVSLFAALSAVCIQIGTNLWNDAADGERGLDTSERLGPPRMTALGLLAAEDVRKGAMAAFLVAGLAGIHLASMGGWPIISIGLLSLVFGYLYSMGPCPLSATALGEVLVIAFFGVAAVAGTVWLQGKPVSGQVVATGFLIGLPAAAVLLLNNHRDRQGDARGGRRTLAILIGEPATRFLFGLLILVALGGLLVMQPGGKASMIAFLPAAAVGLALIRAIYQMPVSRSLNRLIAQTAFFQLLLALALAFA